MTSGHESPVNVSPCDWPIWWLVPVVNDFMEQSKTTSQVTYVFSPAQRYPQR